VFIAGSGPIGCTYARTILDERPSTKVDIAEIGSQDSPIVGAHHKNSIKYQKDFDAFVNVIKGALQPVSIPPGDTYQSTLARAAWAPTVNPLVIHGNNPSQSRERNLKAAAVTRTVGGMASHWTCSCPEPHEEERKELNKVIPQSELKELLARSGKLLNVHSDQYDHSIRHTVVKERVEHFLPNRGVNNIPLAVKRRSDNPNFVTWSGSDTVLGEQVVKIKLHTETRVTKLIFDKIHPRRVIAAILRSLNTNDDILVIAKVFVVACGAIGTPQVLWNSTADPPKALGRHLSEQSMAFCQIVLKREIVDSIYTDPRWKERVAAHKKKYPTDPLPIPFNDPEPQVIIPYSKDYPWHVQVHRDAFSYGDVGPKADPRLVVDLRFFGKSEVVESNRVYFPEVPKLVPATGWEPGVKDIYGMPQATFEVTRTDADGDRDQRMMRDMTEVANALGGYLPDSSYPQMMEPGLALHITGTTRIGADPEKSVANAESRVHGIDNLWVGGNGCIPDATASNPTRTSVAIAIKGANAVVRYLSLPRS
jgi:pyranose oxidase